MAEKVVNEILEISVRISGIGAWWWSYWGFWRVRTFTDVIFGRIFPPVKERHDHL
jgi:hypothetical protein